MLLNRFIFLSFLFISSLFANVKIDINQNAIKGERLDFSIVAIGTSITFPKIESIAGFPVQEVGTSSSTTVVNRTISKKIKKTYAFYPKDDFIFPSLQFNIDSNEFYTKEKRIKVQSASKTKSNYFDFFIKSNNNDLYVNESFILTLTFKYKRVADLLEMNLVPPSFDGFWSKQLNDTKQYEQGEFQVQELKYLLSPLRTGKLEINPMMIQLVMLDNRQNSLSFLSNVTRVHKIYSNNILLNVKEIPHDEKLIGNFDIKASVDKNRIKKGEAVSYKLTISGSGNIDDIGDIKLNIPNATIYENKPKIKSDIKNGNYEGSYEKVYSIVPNESLTIPSVEFSYFSKEIEQVILKQTKSFDIEVIDETNSYKTPTLEKKEEKVLEKQVVKIVEKSSLKDKILFYILGVLSTLLILGLYFYVKNIKLKKKQSDTPLIKRIKKAKSNSDLLKILVAFLDIDENLDKEIFSLEKDENFETHKKNIIKIVKQLKLKG